MYCKTFIVYPSGMQFPTSDLSLGRGDLSNAFFRAHLFAATQAACSKKVSWVTRDDIVPTRCGFGPKAILMSTTALCRIMQKGLNSVYDFRTKAWHPLMEESRSDETKELDVVRR